MTNNRDRVVMTAHMKRHSDLDFFRAHSDMEYRAHMDARREAAVESHAAIDTGSGQTWKINLVMADGLPCAQLTDQSGQHLLIPVGKIWRFRSALAEIEERAAEQHGEVVAA